jgi:hypothetical protein
VTVVTVGARTRAAASIELRRVETPLRDVSAGCTALSCCARLRRTVAPYSDATFVNASPPPAACCLRRGADDNARATNATQTHRIFDIRFRTRAA